MKCFGTRLRYVTLDKTRPWIVFITIIAAQLQFGPKESNAHEDFVASPR